jgi:hypothetical protein
MVLEAHPIAEFKAEGQQGSFSLSKVKQNDWPEEGYLVKQLPAGSSGHDAFWLLVKRG